jgi:hypothetical protein
LRAYGGIWIHLEYLNYNHDFNHIGQEKSENRDNNKEYLPDIVAIFEQLILKHLALIVLIGKRVECQVPMEV